MDFEHFGFTASDPIAELPTDKLDRAMTLRNGVVAMCEGRTKMHDGVYRLLRREFMNDPACSALVPSFVRSTQDTGALWAFLKDKSPQWEPRRVFVREQFSPIIDHLKRPLISPQLSSPNIQTITVIDNPEGIMYNLFVSGNSDAWEGELWTIEESRCVNEYTDESIIKKFGTLDV